MSAARGPARAATTSERASSTAPRDHQISRSLAARPRPLLRRLSQQIPRVVSLESRTGASAFAPRPRAPGTMLAKFRRALRRPAAGGGQAAARPRTFTFAPEPRAPATMLAWLSASLRMRQPRPTSAGMTMLLVANPMPNVSAAGLPTNSATNASSSRCTGVVPAQGRVLSGYGVPARGPEPGSRSLRWPSLPQMRWLRRGSTVPEESVVQMLRSGKRRTPGRAQPLSELPQVTWPWPA